jgi:transposase
LVVEMAQKSYREWSPEQQYLLPPSPSEWLPADHLAYFVIEVVRDLDLSRIEGEIQSKDPRGERPHSPHMMVALLLYSYSTGRFSSRRIARGSYEAVPLRVIAAGEHPHFTSINQFRLDHWESLAALFAQVYDMCLRAGMVRLGEVSLDGAKIKANASKHKAMSYQRMGEEQKRLQAEVEALLKRAEQIDKEEDALYGEGKDREDVPKELARREQRLQKLKAAKAELEKEAAAARAEGLRELAAGQQAKAEDEAVGQDERERAERRAKKREEQAQALSPQSDEGEEDQRELPLNRVPCEPEGLPKPKAQRNFTDPESRIMVKDGAFVQSYNAQIVVDGDNQLIVAQGVSNQSPDAEYLIPMMERTVEACGKAPEALLADSGYFSKENVEAVQGKGPFIAVGREKKAAATASGAASTEAEKARTAMAEKLKERRGRGIYARRKGMVEPVFGQIEQARGFRRFSQRGLWKVRNEWAFVCLTHNLLKLFRHTMTQGLTGRPSPAWTGSG